MRQMPQYGTLRVFRGWLSALALTRAWRAYSRRQLLANAPIAASRVAS
jgi:hypothetical protein